MEKMLHYEQLKERPRDLLAATGLNRAEYEALLESFSLTYNLWHCGPQTKEGQTRKRRVGAGCKGRLVTPCDKLLLMLVYLKTNPPAKCPRLELWLEPKPDQLLDSSFAAGAAPSLAGVGTHARTRSS